MGEKITEDKRNEDIDANRSCTDWCCCLIFVAGFIFMLVVAIMAFANGNPVALTSVFDETGKCCGNVCETYPETEDYPYLYFPVPDYNWMKYQSVCVSECPTSSEFAMNCYGTDGVNTNTTVCPTSTSDDYCTIDESYYQYAGSTAKTDEFCVYETYIFLDRICFPSTSFLDSMGDFASDFKENVNDVINSDALATYVESVTNTYAIIIASFFIALVFSFVYLIYVRYCVGVVVWLTIILYNALFVALGVMCLQNASDYEAENPPNTSDADNQRYIAYILFGCLAVSLIILCCLYSKIKLAIGVMKCASDYLGDVKSALVVPPLFSLVTACYWVLWICAFIYLFSWGTVVQRSQSSVFGEVMWAENVEYYIWFYLFMGLWCNAFISACCQFVLVSAPCIWYFSNPNPSENMHAPVLTSIKRCFRYHLGSLAFGSFLVAVIQFIRIILYYIEQQAKKTGWGEKQPMKYILKYMQCLAACFERFIKFINRNAYIEIAIQGKNFCYSAKEAMRTLWNNAGRATIINGIGAIFIFIGEFLIAMATTFICYLILINQYSEYSPFFPCILIFIISLTVGIMFMSVYGKGIDAIFLCFCHDEENARGKGMQAPEHCPELLKDFFKDRVEPEQTAQAIRQNKVQDYSAQQ